MSLIEEYSKQLAKEIDDELYKFLEENDYYLEKGNVDQIIKLRNDLAKEDKQIRCESTVVSQSLEDPYKIKIHSLIFFDSISHPLSKEQVEELILKSYYLKQGLKE